MNGKERRRPVIGIVPSMRDGKIRMSAAYSEAVFAAGGIPFFIPYTQDAATLDEYAALDGFLYAGGVDVDPAKYGETVLNDTVEIDAERDAFEFALWERIYPIGKPIFGICRGIQSINVALGGSLYQDIPDHHQTEPRGTAPQHVTVDDGSALYGILGSTSVMANSYHHQSVKRPADTLRVSARADDGTVEGVETTESGRFLVAVQWHPELLAAAHPEHAALFAAFVNAAEKHPEK